MAEPEELEEDLFADLYDADESTNRTTSAVEAPKPAVPVPSAIPAQPIEEPSVPSYDPTPVEAYPIQAAPQQDSLSGFQNGAEGISNVPAGAPHADNESHGTGIKEDG
ncbi:RNA-binding protein [Penicillium macrosclerotiorum]|uniref:RNA-binding protein n=1 Tax=Penicillium macrosclerotiorum TaxID=303699 RepID=UPI00254822F2|nr:RNA-binding protein [Penicillium macrosclerotiorum]KAJ5668780.1 RNA-binding protein [Penicillium macrosclerotiorum]